MNALERLSNRMNGNPVDRLPNMCLVMAFAAKQIGVPYGKYVTDYRLLSEGVLRCYEKFHLDMLCVISDPMREAEGLGAKVIIPEDDVPYCKIKRIQSLKDIDSIKLIDPSKSRRMNDRLEAVSLLSKHSMGEVCVAGWVEGALAESCDLMEMSDFMMSMIDEPQAANHLLEICAEQSARFALAQIEAGATLIGIGDAASSLIGPDLYEEFALPYQQKLIEQIHLAGAKVKLHICGNLNPVLELVAKTGADIVDLDYMVDMERAASLFPETMCICGNFDPVSVLLQGTPELVRSEVRNSRRIEKINRSIIAAGCEVPKFTSDENLLAVWEEIRQQ